MADPLATLRGTIRTAADSLGDGAADSIAPTLERPPKRDLGDYSTNAAMLLAPALGEQPRQIAERLGEDLGTRLGDTVERVEVAGPGFVNLFLADRWYRESVAALLDAGNEFGRGAPNRPERVLIEFVSANPTGPLHAASGRHAAYGDALARILAFGGHEVEREYYLNDMGRQVRQFGESIAARMRGDEPPEDGYRGEYVVELAEQLREAGADPNDAEGLARLGIEAMRKRIDATLDRFGVRFDTWSSERSVYESGELEATIETLRKSGDVYESEGALWLRTTDFGDDKDRVIVRSDGEPTYFAAGHRLPLRQAQARRGAPHRRPSALTTTATSPGCGRRSRRWARTRTTSRRRSSRSSTWRRRRAGPDVEAAGRIRHASTSSSTTSASTRPASSCSSAATRPRSTSTSSWRRRQSQDNPVYYVQYAHARIASILRKARAEGSAPAGEGDGVDEEAALPRRPRRSAARRAEPSERALVKRLLELPAEARSAAERRAPHRLAAYATATAADFHAFYRDCQVVGAPDGLEAARLGICVAAKRVIARTLDLLGVSAPDRM